MNHCRRCDSDYEKPGTCNCYAPSTTITPQPYIPSPTVPPLGWPWVQPYTPTWPNGTFIWCGA